MNTILLINPIKRLHPPFGLLYIASSLEKAGFHVEIFEILPQDVCSFEGSLRRLRAEITRLDPLFVGITCMYAQAPIVKTLCGWLKGQFSDIQIVLGGVHPSSMPYRTMEWGADYVVMGEGEKTVVELTNFIAGKTSSVDDIKGIFYRKDGHITATAKQDFIDNLDEIPEPAYHLIPKTRFTRRKGEIRGTWFKCAWFLTSRGCPARCTFCAGHSFFGKKVRFRSLDNIFKELDFLVKEFGIEAFYILDDTFTVRRAHVSEFCKRLKAKYPHLKWACQARVNFFDEDMARDLKDAGCIQVDIGVESGSQRILDLLKKGIKVEQTEKVFAICKKYGLKALATVMIGNPTETREDVDLTRKLLRRINPEFVAVCFTTPFPGTELWTLAKEKGLVNERELETEYKHQLIKPLEWSEIHDEAEWNRIYNEFSSWGIVENYLFNPAFIFSISGFFFFHPNILAKTAFRFLKGNKKGAFQLLTETYI